MTPTQDAYGGSAAHALSSSQGSLPFTGLDIALLLIVAVVLVTLGMLIRKFTQI